MLGHAYLISTIVLFLVGQAWGVAQVGQLICDVTADTMTFDLINNDEDIQGIYGYDEATDTTCTDVIAVVVLDPAGFQINTNTLLTTADPQPCGISIPDPVGSPTTFRYLVVTQSLPAAFAPNDRRYELICDIQGTVTQTTTVESTFTSAFLEAGVPELVGEDLSLRILNADFLAFTDPVTMGTPMVLELQLNQGSMGAQTAMEFQVLSCQAALVEAAPPDPVSLIENSCATFISIFPENQALEMYPFYIPADTPADSYLVRSRQIRAFQFKNTDATSQLLKFTCTVEFCYTAGCFVNDMEPITCPAARKRKKREVNDENQTQAAIAVLDMNDPTLFRSSRDLARDKQLMAAVECERIGYLIGLVVLAAMFLMSMGMTIFLVTRNRQNAHAQRCENGHAKLGYINPEMS